ncbi:MAG TPA: NAD(P)-binding protein [Jatrophihabitans sp.]|nr:NAD(P)-binding protein [Jatrophihabitans sp.]
MKPEPGNPVTVIGAGMAGAACAVALRAAGIPVRVLDQGPVPGGRLASPLLHGRRVDLGAGYFTVRDPSFAAVVRGWADRGLARPWTDTFTVLAADRPPHTSTGPLRWAAPDGLASLVPELLDGITVHTGTEVSELPAGQLVLAMPDPQAGRLIDIAEPVRCQATITVACGYPDRRWPAADAWFVNDHPDLEFVADDGARRGDDAAVLVAHSTAELAVRCLEQPEQAIGTVVAALDRLLGAGRPSWTHVHRWRWAKPIGRHDSTFGFVELPDGRQLGLAGDQCCPDGSPRVESAWRSGTDLGVELASRLTSSRRGDPPPDPGRTR